MSNHIKEIVLTVIVIVIALALTPAILSMTETLQLDNVSGQDLSFVKYIIVLVYLLAIVGLPVAFLVRTLKA